MTATANRVRQRKLGKSGLVVSSIGFGCMGLSEFHAPIPAAEARRAIRRALDLGISHFDTADLYGDGENERLVGRELRARRETVILATKAGIVRDARGTHVDASPKHLRDACEASLRRLGTDHVDLFYLHRVDPATPIEESVAAMATLVRQGKVRFLGLSKVDPAALVRADDVHPVAAVQMQYSVCRREVELELLDVCARRQVAPIAYSPLGKGRLVRRPADATPDGTTGPAGGSARDEFARRWAAAARAVERHAAALGCTPAQLALAWLLDRDRNVIPLPGMRRPAHVDEDVQAVELRLSSSTRAALDAVSPPAADRLSA